MAVLLCSRALSGPWIAHFADASGRRRPWIIATAVASAAAFAMFAWASGYRALFGVCIAFGVAQACSIPLAENLMLLLQSEGRLRYGNLRAWGSFAFLAATMSCGAWIDHSGAGVVQTLSIALLVAGAIASFALPEAAPRERAPAVHFPLRAVFGRRELVFAIVGCGIVQASHATYSTYSTLHWRDAGHSASTSGMLWAEGVLAEILLFVFARQVMRRIDARTLLAIGIAGSAVRWIALGMSTDLSVLIGTQWMHALSFAAVHLALMSFLSARVSHEMSATAQSLYSTFTLASSALATTASAFVYEHDPSAAFTLMSAVALSGGLLAWLGMGRASDRVAEISTS